MCSQYLTPFCQSLSWNFSDWRCLAPGVCKLFTIPTSSEPLYSQSPNLAQMFLYGSCKKCYYFSEQFEIQHGCPGLWLVKTCLYFSRTTACEVSRVCRNISLGVLKKCCYFSDRLIIQDGLHGSDWSRHFRFFSSNLLHRKSPDMAVVFV
jgi:hypothetical protein